MVVVESERYWHNNIDLFNDFYDNLKRNLGDEVIINYLSIKATPQMTAKKF